MAKGLLQAGSLICPSCTLCYVSPHQDFDISTLLAYEPVCVCVYICVKETETEEMGKGELEEYIKVKCMSRNTSAQ